MFDKILSFIKKAFVLIVQKTKTFWQWYKNLYKGKRWYTRTLLVFISAIISLLISFPPATLLLAYL